MTAPLPMLVALSATHRTAGLDDRAAFAVTEEGVARFYAEVRRLGLGEATLLATCNRLECYVVGDEVAALHARAALAAAVGPGASGLDAHLRALPGTSAVEHLFAVTPASTRRCSARPRSPARSRRPMPRPSGAA